MLIQQIKNCECFDEIRPKEYYDYKIGYLLIILNSSACFCRFISYFFFFFIKKFSNELISWENKLTSSIEQNRFNNNEILDREKVNSFRSNDVRNINTLDNSDNCENYLKEILMGSNFSNKNRENISSPDSIEIRYDSNFLVKNIKDDNIFRK